MNIKKSRPNPIGGIWRILDPVPIPVFYKKREVKQENKASYNPYETQVDLSYYQKNGGNKDDDSDSDELRIHQIEDIMEEYNNNNGYSSDSDNEDYKNNLI